jgi:hypothetical protein
MPFATGSEELPTIGIVVVAALNASIKRTPSRSCPLWLPDRGHGRGGDLPVGDNPIYLTRRQSIIEGLRKIEVRE